MGLIASILAPHMYAHAIRNGAANDFANLQPNPGHGEANDALRQFLSYSKKAFDKRVT